MRRGKRRSTTQKVTRGAPYSIEGMRGYQRCGALAGGFAVAALTAVLACAPDAPPEPPDVSHVLILVNSESELSRAIGRYYARKRGIPPEQTLALPLPVSDPLLRDGRHQPIERKSFARLLRDPVERFLRKRGWERRIRTIVTTKGIPLRVAETAGPNADFRERTTASVNV